MFKHALVLWANIKHLIHHDLRKVAKEYPKKVTIP